MLFLSGEKQKGESEKRHLLHPWVAQDGEILSHAQVSSTFGVSQNYVESWVNTRCQTPPLKV